MRQRLISYAEKPKATTYLGKICKLHPELNGERHNKGSGCVACKKERINAELSGTTTYFGKICEKHPELKGKRHTLNLKCTGCLRERAKNCVKKNPDRFKARQAVRHAIQSGQLTRLPCFICGKLEVEAHHASYAPEMRLDVIWLCNHHHQEVHGHCGVGAFKEKTEPVTEKKMALGK